ncbi:hypothetical protein BG005_003932 [Podila minutissima]|nr:hypothetical protein BG005_003932 [Podila minutissima]
MLSSRNIRLQSDAGDVLRAYLQRNNGLWRFVTIDIDMLLDNIDDKFTWDMKGFQGSGTKLSAELHMIYVSWVLNNFDLLQAVDEPDSLTTYYAKASAESEGTFFRTYTVEARVSAMHVAMSNGKPNEHISADVFTAGVSVTTGTYMGVEANVSLFKAKASFLDFNLSVGIGTGTGIKDDFKVAGCGFQIGCKVSISVFGSTVGVDFGRLFG